MAPSCQASACHLTLQKKLPPPSRQTKDDLTMRMITTLINITATVKLSTVVTTTATMVMMMMMMMTMMMMVMMMNMMLTMIMRLMMMRGGGCRQRPHKGPYCAQAMGKLETPKPNFPPLQLPDCRDGIAVVGVTDWATYSSWYEDGGFLDILLLLRYPIACALNRKPYIRTRIPTHQTRAKAKDPTT